MVISSSYAFTTQHATTSCFFNQLCVLSILHTLFCKPKFIYSIDLYLWAFDLCMLESSRLRIALEPKWNLGVIPKLGIVIHKLQWQLKSSTSSFVLLVECQHWSAFLGCLFIKCYPIADCSNSSLRVVKWNSHKRWGSSFSLRISWKFDNLRNLFWLGEPLVSEW